MAGTYTEIVEVVLINSAPAGATVYVGGSIKNISGWSIYVNEWGWYNANDLDFDGWENYSLELLPGAKWPFGDSFIMPNHDVVIELQSYVWYDEYGWVADDWWTKTVKVEGVVEPGFSNFGIRAFNKV